MTMYTSLELSKLLHENGCKLIGSAAKTANPNTANIMFIATYDILYDICLKYSAKFFGEAVVLGNYFGKNYAHGKYYYPAKIFEMLQNNKSQKKIEKYIWDNCKFNPKNKETK